MGAAPIALTGFSPDPPRAAMRRRRGWLLVIAIMLAGAGASTRALGETPVETARGLLRGYHEDPDRIDRARDLLEAHIARDGPDPAALVTLARAWFLHAEQRAETEAARLAAYERGRDVAERAIALAPKDPGAHLWYAINLGSWANAKGLLRSLLALRTIRGEVETVLRLDPRSMEAHVMAGSLHRELPALLGGDREKSERHFRTALALDPRHTGVRIELALLFIATARIGEARRELQAVLDEAAPSDRARWTTKDAPRARSLLDSLRDQR